MTEQWQHRAIERDSPATGGVAITPSDATIIDPPFRGLWVGTAGDVAILHLDGTTVTYPGASGIMPVSGTKVLATGTTATGIVGMR